MAEVGTESVVAPEARGSVWSRVAWLILFLGPLAVVVTAAFLAPDARGHGTHTQLGLPPCGFLVMTGMPCPGCGLTTSFAHMVRFDVGGAAFANPFGILLFLVTAIMIPVAGVGLARGLPFIDTLERLHFEKVAILVSVVGILVWVVRIGSLFLG